MGEMKKLEEVAKAIAGEDLDEGDGLYDWYALVDEVADEYRAMAKAAIEAMRVPTEAMCKAAREEAPNSEYDTFDDDLMTKWYQSVIDEALKE